MSDHWNDLADTLGTPSLTPPKRKSVADNKPAVDKGAVDSEITNSIEPGAVSEPNKSANTVESSPGPSDSTSGRVAATPESPTRTTNHGEVEVAESQPKKRSGWDSLSKLFGIGGGKSDDTRAVPEKNEAIEIAAVADEDVSTDLVDTTSDDDQSQPDTAGFGGSVSLEADTSDESNNDIDDGFAASPLNVDDVDPDSLLSRKSAWTFSDADESAESAPSAALPSQIDEAEAGKEKNKRNTRRGKRAKDRKLPKMWEDDASSSHESNDTKESNSKQRDSGFGDEIVDTDDLSFDGFGTSKSRQDEKRRRSGGDFKDEELIAEEGSSDPFDLDEASTNDSERRRGRKRRGGRRAESSRERMDSDSEIENGDSDSAERRGRRRRPRRAEALADRDVGQSESSSKRDEFDGFEEPRDEAEPRRGKRSRRRERDLPPEDRDSAHRGERDDSDEDLDFDDEVRSRHRRNRDEADDDNSDRTARRGNRGRRGRRGEGRRGIDEDDNSPRAQRQRNRNAKIPTWLDAITPMIDSNIENHERQGNSGGSRRRNSRGNNSKSN